MVINMRYEILDENGNIINRIVADIDFVQKHYPNRFREMGDFLPVPLSDQELSNLAREKRNALLFSSDWTQLSDSPVNKQEWAVYREALRDIPEQREFPKIIDWPQTPA